MRDYGHSILSALHSTERELNLLQEVVLML